MSSRLPGVLQPSFKSEVRSEAVQSEVAYRRSFCGRLFKQRLSISAEKIRCMEEEEPIDQRMFEKASVDLRTSLDHHARNLHFSEFLQDTTERRVWVAGLRGDLSHRDSLV